MQYYEHGVDETNRPPNHIKEWGEEMPSDVDLGQEPDKGYLIIDSTHQQSCRFHKFVFLNTFKLLPFSSLTYLGKTLINISWEDRQFYSFDVILRSTSLVHAMKIKTLRHFSSAVNILEGTVEPWRRQIGLFSTSSLSLKKIYAHTSTSQISLKISHRTLLILLDNYE